MKKESEYPKWRRIFSAAADAQGFADVPDVKKDRTKMTASEIDLDDVQNKAMCPVFQQTLLTPETSAIVLELEITSLGSSTSSERRDQEVIFVFADWVTFLD